MITAPFFIEMIHITHDDQNAIILQAYDSLPLMSPTRGMSMAEACLIETDIRIKVQGEDATRDLTMADGCRCLQDNLCSSFDYHSKIRIDGELGAVLTHSMLIQDAVEATIQLDFRRLPTTATGGGDFRVRMTGYTRARPPSDDDLRVRRRWP